MMKRPTQIIILIVIGLGLMVSIELYPKLGNMSSEYGTANAIRDIEVHLRENDGRWPSSPKQLDNNYPVEGEVLIDYSARSDDLIGNPHKLPQAVRPRSGKFLTYPHYESQIKGLLNVLHETNKRE